MRSITRDEKLCPNCGCMAFRTSIEGVLRCECLTCNGFKWHICPEHRVKVSGWPEYWGIAGCTCEKGKK